MTYPASKNRLSGKRSKNYSGTITKELCRSIPAELALEVGPQKAKGARYGQVFDDWNRGIRWSHYALLVRKLDRWKNGNSLSVRNVCDQHFGFVLNRTNPHVSGGQSVLEPELEISNPDWFSWRLHNVFRV